MRSEIRFDQPPTDADLDALVGTCKSGRYLEDAGLPPEGARRLVCENLRQLSTRSKSGTITAGSADGPLDGILLFRLSDWDSAHFGFPVATIDAFVVRPSDHRHELETARGMLAEFSSWCASEKIRFVSTRIPALDLSVIHALEESGFHYIESWVYNTLDLSRELPGEEALSGLRLAVPADKATMLEYSKEAFATQRFHADANFDPEKADSLYRKWIDSAFEDTTQRIAVFGSDGKPKAFMVYFHSDLREFVGKKFAMWKMALLDPSSRGRGLGTRFFGALARHHRNEGMDAIDSGLSLRNLASLNLHNKNRFKIVSTMITFHRWVSL